MTAIKISERVRVDNHGIHIAPSDSTTRVPSRSSPQYWLTLWGPTWRT